MPCKHGSLLLAFLVALCIGSPAHAQGDINCEILMKSVNGRSYTLTYGVTAMEADDIANEPARFAQFAAKAKSDYATKLGYTKAEFGEQNWKVVPGVKLARVTLVHSDGRRIDVRVPETRR